MRIRRRLSIPILSIYLRDPDGNLIEIANQIEDHIRFNRPNVMRPLLSLFRINDRFTLAVILVLSVTAGRLPEIFDSRYPYPTTLYSIFGTIAQSLAPLLAVALFLLLYRKDERKNAYRQSLLKGACLLGGVILLALALMPFSELIYDAPGVRQGIVAGITLSALWSVGQTVFSIVRAVLDEGE